MHSFFYLFIYLFFLREILLPNLRDFLFKNLQQLQVIFLLVEVTKVISYTFSEVCVVSSHLTRALCSEPLSLLLRSTRTLCVP